nr:hypothetical protein [Tanacetum cinerariifolium]
MARLTFYDYHNMIAILEKYEHNTDFHQIVDFVEASHLRIETTDEGTKNLATVDDELVSPIGDDSQGKACPTDSGLEAEHDREKITKTSTLPSDSTTRLTSLAADEGSMQQQLNELTDLCTRLQRQQTEMASKIASQDLEISQLKARVKLLEDRDGGGIAPSGEDAPIKGRSLDEGEEACIERSTEKGSNDTKEMKRELQEQIDVQMARQLEEEMERDAQRMNEQITRDAKISRIHAEEELQRMIDGLDRNNETVAKYLQKYHQFAVVLSIRERIELINDLVKYQDNYAKVLKYQTQQKKPLSKKQPREFYTSVLKSHTGWKAKHFKGMTLKEIRENFDPVWKQIEDFIPIGSKEEGERFKRKGIRFKQDSAKKVKHLKIDWEIQTEGQRSYWKIIRLGGSTTSYQFFVDMLKHFDREDLNQLWALVKETLNIRQAVNEKEKELWVELKRLFEPDVEDQLSRNIHAGREGLPVEKETCYYDD